MSESAKFYSSIWEEEAQPDDPFTARVCYCHGYDVFGDLLGKISWPQFLLLLFRGESPAPLDVKLLENLAVALANPGPREAGVRAAMCAGVGGSTAASALIAALSVGAGQLGGARDLHQAIILMQSCDRDLNAWDAWLTSPPKPAHADIWSDMEHVPGFNPNGVSCALTVSQLLSNLMASSSDGHLTWLAENREYLEARIGYPLALSGVAAAAFCDLGFTPEQGEMLFLLLRLPGAAVHALEQQELGWKKFPFAKTVELTDDPGFKGLPDVRELLP